MSPIPLDSDPRGRGLQTGQDIGSETHTIRPRRVVDRLHGLLFVYRAATVLWSNSRARAGLLLVGLFVFIAIFGSKIAPYSATDDSFPPSQNTSLKHPLGTTNFGQDVLSQLLVGTRLTLFIGLLAAALATIISVTVGLLMGYLRGGVDHVLGFVTNLALVIPLLPLMIVLAAYLRGTGFMVLVLVIGGWAFGARVVRAQASSLRTRDFVVLARFSGESSFRIIFREVLPNMISLVAASFFLTATFSVLAMVALEFIGLGDLTATTWGTMIYWAQNAQALRSGQWAWVLAPGICIALLATGYSLINFGVDALSNPRLREEEKNGTP
jgi:peptide/nickel transport system permease protein